MTDVSSSIGIVAAGAAEKARGLAPYTRDLIQEGAAVVGVVESPHPHAVIETIETACARNIPGVLDVLTGEDFGSFRLGGEIPDQPVLAAGKVRFVGEPVVAVAATDPEALRRGLEAVEIGYRVLPSAVSWRDALAEDVAIHADVPSNVAQTYSFERGDPRDVENVEVVVEGTFRVAAVQHAYMEPHAVWCRFDEPADTVVLYAATHAPFRVLEEYLSWFERFPETVVLRTPAVGGSFGAKYEHPLHMVCAEFCRRLRRDVGLVLPRVNDFRLANSRADTELHVRIGASCTGRLISKETSVVMDNGAYSLHGPSVLLAALERIDNLYRWRYAKGTGRLVYTNTPPTQCYRGFGDPEGAFAQEQLLDELAARLQMSPGDLRRRNCTIPGDTTIHGWQVGSCRFAECLDRVEASVIEDREHHPIAEKIQAGSLSSEGSGVNATPDPAAEVELDGITLSERYVTGWGIAGGMHVVGNRDTKDPDESRVRLRCTPQGLIVWSGEVDVGGGAAGVLAEIASHALDIPISRIRVVLGDSITCPPGAGSWASRTTFFAGNALLDACRILSQRCLELGQELGVNASSPSSWWSLAGEATRRGREKELEVDGRYVSARSEVRGPSGEGNRAPAYSFAVHGCRVRVDRWTGAVAVERYWTMHDIGKVLLPAGAEGQVRGGVAQGLGHALTERVVRAEDGRMLNDGFLDYRVPTSQDAVPIEVGFVDATDDEGPLGAKAVAELPMIPVAACVANAIRDAVGVAVLSLPLEPEVVLAVLDAADAIRKGEHSLAR